MHAFPTCASGTFIIIINVGPRMAPAVLDAQTDRRRQRDAPKVLIKITEIGILYVA